MLFDRNRISFEVLLEAVVCFFCSTDCSFSCELVNRYAASMHLCYMADVGIWLGAVDTGEQKGRVREWHMPFVFAVVQKTGRR